MIVCDYCCYNVPAPVFQAPPGFVVGFNLFRYTVIGIDLAAIGLLLGILVYREWWLKRTSMHMQGGSA